VQNPFIFAAGYAIPHPGGHRDHEAQACQPARYGRILRAAISGAPVPRGRTPVVEHQRGVGLRGVIVIKERDHDVLCDFLAIVVGYPDGYLDLFLYERGLDCADAANQSSNRV